MKIEELTLYTRRLSEQKVFYSQVLGLEETGSLRGSISFQVGHTLLKFIEKDTAAPYHFAFNIPAEQISEALEWLKKRVEIQRDGTNEVVDFPAWNARSIYFYDADHNILEFIGRKNIKTTISLPFSGRSLFEISEIGLATDKFEEIYHILHNDLKLNKFGGGKEVFAAFGSENGLFILIDKSRKDWFPTNDKAYAAEFKTILNLNDERIEIEYTNEILSFYPSDNTKK